MAVEAAIPVSAANPVRTALAGTIRQAASATGVNFGYLVAAAKIESNLNPSAAAPSSSARGLYQFIEQTWLGTVKEAGSYFGYNRYADAITRTPSGRYEVSDPAMRNEILQLRKDPAANAAMAGVLTRSNGSKLTSNLGRRPSEGELYIAHFLGAGGASRLIAQAETNPQANAAAMFPRAAAANRSIFYANDGTPRTASQVYATLTGRYATAARSADARSMIAAAGVAPPTGSTLAALSTSTMAQASAYAPEASEAESRQRGIAERNARFSFHAMFQTGDRAEPVSAAVRELWANGSTSSTAGIASDVQKPAVAAPAAPAASAGQSQPLDLFSDRFGAYRS
jgi:hypothetical protein